jgi:hypothetical protein
MRTGLLVVIAFLALFPCCVFGQWIPVSANETSTEDVIGPDGQVTSHRVVKQRYYRSSSGSILVQDIANDGTNAAMTAFLLDYSNTLRSYVINYQGLRAIDNQRPLRKLPAPWTRADIHNDKILGEEVVEGIPCVILPIYAHYGFRGPPVLIGKAWVAPDYNHLIVKEDSTDPQPGGISVHLVRELHDISAGIEPDPALFATDAESLKRAAALR